MSYVSLDEYLQALDSTGVSDLDANTKTDFINMARNQIVDAFPWTFRLGTGTPGETFRTLTDPASQPFTGNSSQFVKVNYAVSADHGQLLTPLTPLQMAERGISFDPITGLTEDGRGSGEPVYYCVYHVTDLTGAPNRSTWVIPYPYGPIKVNLILTAGTLDPVSNPTENLIPREFKWAVVYAASVHAHTMLGVLDMAAAFQTRYQEQIEFQRNGQFNQTFQSSTISYQQDI